jgi:hypothetical protein
MSHPCAGHSCDHCYVCDVLGICCASVPNGQVAQLEAEDQAQRDRLHTAIAQDAPTVPRLPQLVQLEAQLRSALPAAERLGLVAAATDPLSSASRKETIRVLLARAPR